MPGRASFFPCWVAAPDGTASAPLTVDFELAVGTQGYSGAVHLGEADLQVKGQRWKAR